MRLRDRIQEWYRGPFVAPQNDPSSPIIVLGHHEPPVLAKLLGALVGFWLAHWKWLIGTTVAIIAIFTRVRP